MFLPQVVRFLLSQYGFRGTILVIGSLSLHGVIGACLFQPVQWNMKKSKTDEEDMKETEPLIKRPEPLTSVVATNETNENDFNFWQRITQSMELTLLKDPRFVILNFGLACAYTVSIDFTIILPFFLQVSLN